MKIIITLCLLFFSFTASANLTENEVKTMVISMSEFAEKKLTANDLPELTQQLKNILILEDNDPTRSGPFELTNSYTKNKSLYTRAVKTFSKDDQKVLKEVLKLVEDLAKNGNG